MEVLLRFAFIYILKIKFYSPNDFVFFNDFK